MDDLSAFDRQLASAMAQRAGPVRPVDDAAVLAAVTATQSPKWRFQSMFSATKFVVAGAIVALFGGLLLTGVLTQPSDDRLPVVGASASATTQAEPSDAATSEAEPTTGMEADTSTTAPDLLPGADLVTEEVEPGVFRVLSDGVREPVRLSEGNKQRDFYSIFDGNIVTGLDGSVWWFGTDGFYRLGEEAMHRWPKGISQNLPPVGRLDIEVGPDGTVWLPDWDDISSYDGQAWSKRWRGTKKRSAVDVEVQPDGTVWMAWVTGPADRKGSVRAARLGDDDWEALPGSVQNRDPWNYNDLLNHTDLIVSDEGDTPLVRAIQRLRRHDGDDWVVQPSPDAGRTMRAAVGPDGTLWVRLNSECKWRSPCPSDILAHFDGEDWEVFDSSDGIPGMGDHYAGFEGFFEVAPDRSVWFDPIWEWEEPGRECDGVANFDGEAVTYFLRDTCIYAMDIAPDGTVWLQAGEFPGAEASPIYLYVITPEAVTGTK